VNEEDVGEEVVVGLHVPPSNGLRVKMRPEFMSQGRGTITKVNEKRGFVSVRWDSGRNDPCLYVGGGGRQYFLEVLRFPADKGARPHSLSCPHDWRLHTDLTRLTNPKTSKIWRGCSVMLLYTLLSYTTCAVLMFKTVLLLL
jgi:hypothetical protein